MRVFSTGTLRLLTAGVAASVLAAGAVHAQTVEDPAGDSPRDRNTIDSFDAPIIVTATKSANPEDVQDVPLSVTAFNEDSLEALKVRDIQSLTYSAPNVSLDQVGTTRGSANFSMRGLGVNSSIPSIDPTVGVFIDGVYLGVNAGVVLDLFDLDSVELVRGPQGILFGRNTTGGAVLINTGNPTEDFRLKVRGAMDGPVNSGRGGVNMTGSALLSGPIIEDTLLFKVGAYFNSDAGYFKNLATGRDFGEAETTILRGALELRPSDALRVVGKIDYFDSTGQGPAGQNHGRFPRDTFDFAIDNEGSYTNETITASLRADLDIGPGTLTNIFGYRDFEGTTNGDIDALPAFLFHSPTEFTQDQISNELRYAARVGALEFTVGGYYFHQDLAYTEIRRLPPLSPLTFYGGGTQDHDVYGVFGQGKFFITDALAIIAGLRWSQEDKADTVTYIRPRPACSVVAGTCPITGNNPFIPGEPNGFADANSWKNWAPKLGAQYEFGNSQIYGHWTRGYRSGGYNFRITDAAVFLNTVVPASGGNFYFDEEKVDNYEIGAKFQTDDRRLTLNAAAYYTDISNLQREVNQSSVGSGVLQSILNTADATIKGFEVEGRFRVMPSLIITGNFGYIDAEYDRTFFDISGNGVANDAADLALKLPRVPKHTYGVGLLHELELGGGGAIVTRVNFQHRDRFAYTDNNFGYITASDNIDANITWDTWVRGMSFSIYGKNLLDEVQHGGDTHIPFGGPLSNGVNAPFDPRPAAGTFSPLNKGRVIGFEVSMEI